MDEGLHCRAFIAKKEGPYPWDLSFKAVLEALSPRSIGDKADLVLAKFSIKVSMFVICIAAIVKVLCMNAPVTVPVCPTYA